MDFSALAPGISILLIFSLCGCIDAYPNGKVEDSCVSMLPNHGVSAQTSSAPYVLTVSKTTYSAGEQITVTLNGSSVFEGFLIQARSANSQTPLGTFVVSNLAQTLTCTTAASAVSHTSDAQKSSVQVTWTAPSNINTSIQLKATVLRSGKVFWTDVLSCPLTFNSTSSSLSGTSCSGTLGSGSSNSFQNSVSILYVLIPVMVLIWL